MNCISEINITQILSAKDLCDVVMPMYNLIEYSDNYSEKSGSLWKYYRIDPFLDNNKIIMIFLVIVHCLNLM